VRYGSAGKCVPGWNLHVLDPQLATGASAETFQVLAQHVPDKAAEGPLHDASASGGLPATHHHNLHAAPVLKEARAGELGPLVIRLPMPPGSLTGLLHAEGRFKKGYLDNYPGYFDTGAWLLLSACRTMRWQDIPAKA
jgi:acyl-coenzyme A synthetase/AMP-(fatty) acid ligase